MTLKLKPHDGITEWCVCRSCGTTINWADESFGPQNYPDRDAWEAARSDTSCPYCGSEDTDWLPA